MRKSIVLWSPPARARQCEFFSFDFKEKVFEGRNDKPTCQANEFLRRPIQAVQKYLLQVNNIYYGTKMFITVEKYLFRR